jgi:DNA-binding GntR family transcriptional regulator
MNAVPQPLADQGSLAEQAYRRLEEQLVTLKLAPGEFIGEKDLVDSAGIGRTPVREAIQRLSAEGLLQVLPRKGLMVTPLRRSDLMQIIETRRVLERLMVVKAAERATPDQRQALRILASHLDAAGDDLEVFFRLDHRLDELLEAACNNRYLVKALAAMHSQCRRLWYLHRRRLNLPRSAQLHAGLARAVADENGAGAIRALDEIITILENLVNGLDVLS